MYRTEKQFNSRASEYTIEEVYTNNDVEPNDLKIPDVGFAFKYPQRWLNDPSQNKVIGIRRLNIKPTHHIINYRISIKIPGEDDPFNYNGRVEVLPDNNLLEILNEMFNKFMSYSKNVYTDITKHNFMPIYVYRNNTLLISIFDLAKSESNSQNSQVEFAFYDTYNITSLGAVDNIDKYPLLTFLNQPIDPTIDYSKIYKKDHVYNNVWDRDYIQFHASFSDSNKSFIGLRDDFYNKPSVIYKAPNDGSTFHVRFTTNGKTPILPLYCRFIVQLCFIVNYKKVNMVK